jgi:hypothetical protein
MVIVSENVGDILLSDSKFIAQQNNCCTTKAHGLSDKIARKYPYANVYSLRINKPGCRNNSITRDIPGTIKVCDGPGPTIICMFAQYCPGKPEYYAKIYDKTYHDTYDNRLIWFKMCLDKILEAGITEVSMPYYIGCGLAGGDWTKYYKVLQDTELKVNLWKYSS